MNARFGKSTGISMAGKSFFLLAGLLLALSLQAADTDSGFEQANKLYEQGKYADATTAYDKLIEAGNTTGTVYYNRGNAFFKLGQIGRAIASYRQAEQFMPRDPDLRANLQFARTQARGGSNYRVDRWHRWLGTLSVNEWTWLTVGSFWLLFLLLALIQWRPALKQSLRNFIFLSGFIFVFLAVCLGTALTDYFTQSAIIVTGEAEVRNGPLEESQTAYKVRDGVELNILDRKDGWYQVADSSQRIGWIRQEQVLVFQPGNAQKKSG